MEILSHKTTSLSMSPEYTLRSIHSQHRSLRVLERDHRSVTWCCGGPLETVGDFFLMVGETYVARDQVRLPNHFPTISPPFQGKTNEICRESPAEKCCRTLGLVGFLQQRLSRVVWFLFTPKKQDILYLRL